MLYESLSNERAFDFIPKSIASDPSPLRSLKITQCYFEYSWAWLLIFYIHGFCHYINICQAIIYSAD